MTRRPSRADILTNQAAQSSALRLGAGLGLHGAGLGTERYRSLLPAPSFNELVNWFNAVDATYRTDLRELNELNFARFDAKLGERLAALDARLAALGDTLRKELAQSLSEVKSGLLKWMFGFWASAVLALVVLAFRR